MELKRDLQGKKQQELRNIRTELQRLEGSSSRLQELENELAKAVSIYTVILNYGHLICIVQKDMHIFPGALFLYEVSFSFNRFYLFI